MGPSYTLPPNGLKPMVRSRTWTLWASWESGESAYNPQLTLADTSAMEAAVQELLTTHYSAAELRELIDAMEFIATDNARESCALTLLKRKAG